MQNNSTDVAPRNDTLSPDGLVNTTVAIPVPNAHVIYLKNPHETANLWENFRKSEFS